MQFGRMPFICHEILDPLLDCFLFVQESKELLAEEKAKLEAVGVKPEAM